jgi:hypothetical protein
MAGIPVIDTRLDAGPTDTAPWSNRPMTVDEFYAFTDTRPDGEKWELIEGEPVLNASPSRFHQWIARNVIVALTNREREINAPWVALYDIGVRVSEKDRPEPDILVYPSENRRPDERRDCDDVLVAFEVLAPSTEKRDLGWKRKAYTACRRSPTTSRCPRTPSTSGCSPATMASRSAGSSPWTRRSTCPRSAFHCRWRRSTAILG